ncbi:uncharacterized protein LOC113382798 isoform X2 [Ctenocephalides felis]|uniref:uncharacterized protein LOC113382798 isoform X2 n=1 Tax=Ctenocephalides felis TaxID=7515 RepID=UPI000E6E28CE|nr:uncharacterized protein LOC113382798 isoform X2 [Ctenocephalides felis]
MFANLNAGMAPLILFGFLAMMITISSAYPPHYLDFWQHDPPAYSPQGDSWNSDPLSASADRSSSRRIDSSPSGDFHHNHHQQYPERRYDGRHDYGEGVQNPHRRVEQQSPPYSNVGLYGTVHPRDGVGVRVADGPGPNVQGQGHGVVGGFPNQIGTGGHSGRRKVRPHVNGRRGRRNETAFIHDINNGAPQVHRRNGTLVLVYPTQKPTLTRGKRGGEGPDSEGPDIFFPTDRPNAGMTPVIADRNKGLECARGSTFCEKVEGYPKEFLSTILQKEARKYMDLFGEDQVESVVNVTNRIDSNDDEPLCASKEEIVYPQAAQNKDDQWLYIINQEGYTQGVRIEKCADTSGQCGSLQLPLNYETGCKQKYIYRKLLAVNGTGIVSDSFRLPSCCACYIRNSGAASRIAGNPFNASSRQSSVLDKSRTAASTGYN